MSADQVDLSADQVDLSADQFEPSSDHLELSADQVELSADQVELSAEQFELSAGHVDLSADQFQLSADQVELSADQVMFVLLVSCCVEFRCVLCHRNELAVAVDMHVPSVNGTCGIFMAVSVGPGGCEVNTYYGIFFTIFPTNSSFVVSADVGEFSIVECTILILLDLTGCLVLDSSTVLSKAEIPLGPVSPKLPRGLVGDLANFLVTS